MNKKDIAQILQQLDCCMMTTIDGNGNMNTRPMLHNKSAQFDGKVYYFSMQDTRKVRDLNENPNISLTYQNRDNTLFLQLSGKGEVVYDSEKMKPHWDNSLDLWWKERERTPGMCMVCIHVSKARVWHEGKDVIVDL